MGMRKTWPALALTVALAFPFACGDSTDPSGGDASWESLRSDLPRETAPGATTEEVDAVVRGGADFVLDLMGRVEGEGNLLLSPTSIRIAFAMVYGGAHGQTATEMETVLRYGGVDDVHEVLNAIDLALAERNLPEGDEGEDPVELRLANAFWGRVDYPFRDDYLDLLAVNYGAGIERLDFGASEEARAVINGWVEERTNDRIRDLLPAGSIDALVVAVLTNALYFRAPWAEPFAESLTVQEMFRRGDGSEVSVPTMHRAGELPYGDAGDCRALELPYRGGALGMVLLLPDGDDLASFVSSLTGERLFEIVGTLEETEALVSLPRFEFESSLELRDHLMAMGMPLVFTSADLSGMSDLGGLFVDQAYHKTFVAVDEKGTEAAAATAVVIRENAIDPEVEFACDRPFLFFIRDRVTGEILFLGRVEDPSS